ncbi:MAG: DUF2442 domain-containing protein [bacterium]
MKLNPRIRKVLPESDFRLRLTFSNGEVRVYDARPLLKQGGVFDELKDESAFRSVHPWHGTVQWAGGQDLCPDTLYEDSILIAKAQPLAVREPKAAYSMKKQGKKRG